MSESRAAAVPVGSGTDRTALDPIIIGRITRRKISGDRIEVTQHLCLFDPDMQDGAGAPEDATRPVTQEQALDCR